MKPGAGYAACHHGEILQGVFPDEDERPCRALVTLPMAEPLTKAVFVPSASGPPHVSVEPRGSVKAARAAQLALAECVRLTGGRVVGGRLCITGGPARGLGMGSSTSDVTAAIRAVCAASRVVLEPAAVARVAVAAESACDPIMHGDHPMLFAQREGKVVENLGAALPAMVVVGCLTGAGQPVDTLDLSSPVRPEDITGYERLRSSLRTAIAKGDAAAVGQVSTESAILNQRVLPKAELEVLRDVARTCGAVGVQVAHSGNVAGILFDSTAPDLATWLAAASTRLIREGLPPIRTFSTPNPYTGERSWTSTYPTLLADQT